MREESNEAAFVTAKCVGCGCERDIYAGEVPPGTQPTCDKCFMPMVAKSATVTRSVPDSNHDE